jgi:hypothetical protein
MSQKTLNSLGITFVILFIAFGFAVIILAYINDYHKTKHPPAKPLPIEYYAAYETKTNPPPASSGILLYPK